MSLYGTPSIMEWLVIQYATGDVDDRLTEFLDSFKKKGRFSIEFGFFTCTVVWNSRSKKHTIVNIGERHTLTIKDGIILNREEIHDVLRILDTADISAPLPVFKGEEATLYTLKDGGWVKLEELREDNTFYVAYSVA